MSITLHLSPPVAERPCYSILLSWVFVPPEYQTTNADLKSKSPTPDKPQMRQIKPRPMDKRVAQRLVVKSVSCSTGFHFPSGAFSQVQASGKVVSTIDLRGRGLKHIYLLAGRDPQAQDSPAGLTFSDEERSQLQSPAGRARHEQRGPETAFSVEALSHVQWRADCFPHEHLACWAEGMLGHVRATIRG